MSGGTPIYSPFPKYNCLPNINNINFKMKCNEIQRYSIFIKNKKLICFLYVLSRPRATPDGVVLDGVQFTQLGANPMMHAG